MAMDAWICQAAPHVCAAEHRPAQPRPAARAPKPELPWHIEVKPAHKPTPQREHSRPESIPTEVAASGTRIVVFIEQQWLCAYHDGQIARVGGTELCSPVSTGSRGHETPLTDPQGSPQRVVWKDRDHCSKEYPYPNQGCSDGGAPMPYAMFFDTEGHALHAGHVRRPTGTPYGESHGCVRLPNQAAAQLFEFAKTGTTEVVIAWNPATYRLLWEPPVDVSNK